MGQGWYLRPPSRHTVEQGGSQDTPGSCLSRQQLTEDLHSFPCKGFPKRMPQVRDSSSEFCLLQ